MPVIRIVEDPRLSDAVGSHCLQHHAKDSS